MKNIALFFSLIVIIALTSVSCKHSNREQRLAKADSLSMALNRVDSMLNIEINYDSITSRFNELKKYQEVLSPYKLKFSQKEKSDYNQFMSSEKHYKTMINVFDKYKTELEYSKTQVNNLKNDFEKRVIKKEKFDMYYETENKAVYKLLNNVKSDLFKTNKHHEKNSIFKPVLDSLMIKYVNKIK